MVTSVQETLGPVLLPPPRGARPRLAKPGLETLQTQEYLLGLISFKATG